MIECVLLILAFTLDLCIGDPKWLPHPVRIMGRGITRIENLLSKILLSITRYSSLVTRHFFERLAGVSLVVIMVSFTYGLFYVINSVLLTSNFSFLTSYLSLLVMVYLISTTLATKGLIDSARTVIEALKSRNIEAARENLHHIVGRDTDSLDEKGVLRATIESLAENASDGIIAPLFYFAIGGLPLAMTYKAINTMDSMVGYRNERYRNSGWAAARLDDIANYIPARITGILIATASSILNWSLVTCHCSLKIMLRDGRKHPSLNSGVPEAAMAGALGIRLGGPSTYRGMVVDKPCIGEDRQKAEQAVSGEQLAISEKLTANRQLRSATYLEASEKAMNITKITSLLGLVISIVILQLRGSV